MMKMKMNAQVGVYAHSLCSLNPTHSLTDWEWLTVVTAGQTACQLACAYLADMDCILCLSVKVSCIQLTEIPLIELKRNGTHGSQANGTGAQARDSPIEKKLLGVGYVTGLSFSFFLFALLSLVRIADAADAAETTKNSKSCLAANRRLCW